MSSSRNGYLAAARGVALRRPDEVRWRRGSAPGDRRQRQRDGQGPVEEHQPPLLELVERLLHLLDREVQGQLVPYRRRRGRPVAARQVDVGERPVEGVRALVTLPPAVVDLQEVGGPPVRYRSPSGGTTPFLDAPLWTYATIQDRAGGAVLSRTTSVVANSIRVWASVSPAARVSTMVAAAAPISTSGCRTVVMGG